MKRILFPCFFLAAVLAHAQTATITLSKEFALRDRGLTNKEGTTLRLGDYYYCMEYVYRNIMFAYTARLDKIRYGINVYKYTADMKEVGKTELNKGEKEYGPFQPQTVVQNNQLLIFYYQAQEDHSIKLFVAAIDPETLKEVSTQELYTMTERNVGLFNLESAMEGNKLKLWRSPDQTQLLVSQSGNTNEVYTCILNSNNQVTKPIVSVIKNKQSFAINNIFIDEAGTKYLSYTYTLNKFNKRGVLLQTNQGKESYIDFNTGQSQWESNTLNFHLSNDHTKMFVYANYYGDYMDEGVLLSTIDAQRLAFGTVQLFGYTADIRENMNRLGFGSKNKGNLTVNRIEYTCSELEDGTLALTGYPSFTQTATYTSGGGTTAIGTSMPSTSHTVTKSEAGPVVNVFIKDGQGNFGLLYRRQGNSDAAGFIVVPYKQTLVCIYCDSKKNLEYGNEEKVKTEDNAAKLVLVQAVIRSDGSLLSRQEIAGDPVGSNYYFLDYNQHTGKNTFIVPIGRQRMNMTRYFTEIVQWATITLN